MQMPPKTYSELGPRSHRVPCYGGHTCPHAVDGPPHTQRLLWGQCCALSGFEFLELEPARQGGPCLNLTAWPLPATPGWPDPRWLATSGVTSGPLGCHCPAPLQTRAMGVAETPGLPRHHGSAGPPARSITEEDPRPREAGPLPPDQRSHMGYRLGFVLGCPPVRALWSPTPGSVSRVGSLDRRLQRSRPLLPGNSGHISWCLSGLRRMRPLKTNCTTGDRDLHPDPWPR